MLFCVFLHLNFNQTVYDCVIEVDTYERSSLVNSVLLNIFVNCVQFSSIWFTLLVMICTLQIHTCSWLQAATLKCSMKGVAQLKIKGMRFT